MRNLILNTLFFPMNPTVKILIDFQLHLFLFLFDYHFLPFFHRFNYIFRDSTILEPIINLIKFHPIFMHLLLFFKPSNQLLSSLLFLFIIFPFSFLQYIDKYIPFGDESVLQVILNHYSKQIFWC